MPGPLSNPNGTDPKKLATKRARGEVVVTGKTAVKRKSQVRDNED